MSSSRIGPAIAACLCLWHGGQCLAHLPAAYGRDYLRVEDIAPPATAPPGTDPTIPPSELTRYSDRVSSLERSHGPFAKGLTEPLQTLARHYASEKQWLLALALYQRATYVERVNSGLNSPRLQPLLEEQLAIYRKLDDLEGQDRAQAALYRARGDGRPPFTPERLAAAIAYQDWQRQAALVEGEKHNASRLANLLEENQRLLDEYLGAGEVDPDWELRLRLSQLDNLYLLRSMEPDSPEVPGALAGGLAGDAQRLGMWQRGALGRGADLVRDYLERWPDTAPAVRAELLLELGDWYQWNDRWRSARATYLELWDLLGELDQASLRQDLLGAPVELPAGRRFTGSEAATDSRVTLRFSVSPSGQVRAVELVEGDDPAASRIRRLLREAHFRPAFSEREALETQGILRTYVWLE